MAAGTHDITNQEIIVDRVFAKKYDVGLGDVLDINDQKLTIAGISAGGDMVVFQYGFVTAGGHASCSRRRTS